MAQVFSLQSSWCCISQPRSPPPLTNNRFQNLFLRSASRSACNSLPSTISWQALLVSGFSLLQYWIAGLCFLGQLKPCLHLRLLYIRNLAEYSADHSCLTA